jgi:hypothetical protein
VSRAADLAGTARHFRQRLLGLPLRAPRTVVGVAAVVTALFGWLAPQVGIDGSMESLLVAGDPERAYHAGIERTFGSDEVTRIGVFADDVFAPATLARIDRLTRTLARIDGIDEVVSLTSVTGVESTPEGIRVGRVLRRLPRTAQDAAAFRTRILGDPIYRGSVVAPDGRAAAISVLFEPLSDEELEARDVVGRIRAAVDGIGGPEEYAVSGIPTLKIEGARRMERDVRTFSVLAVLLVAFVLGLMFRSPRGVLLPLTAIAIGVVWTDGLMKLVGQPITIGTLVLNPMLMAVGVCDAIHVMSRYLQEMRAGRPTREALEATLEHVGMPVVLAALTTLFGFATLIPHPVPTVRDLGLYASFGITVITLASLFVMPAILMLLPPPRRLVAASAPYAFLVDRLQAIAEFSVDHATAVRAGTVVLCGLGLFAVARVRVETDYLGFFDPASRVRIDSERIATRLAGMHPLYVIVEGGGPGSITRPEALAGMRRLQDFIDGRPGVDKSVSVLDYLARARQVLLPDAPPALPATLEEAEQILVHADPRTLRHALARDGSRAAILLYTRLSSSAEVERFLEGVEDFARRTLPAGLRAHVTGSVVLLNRTADTLAWQQLTGLVNMLAALLPVMALFFRSFPIALRALFPNVVPIVLLFALMGVTGVSLNVSTSMIAAIALGIVVDDTTYYLADFAGELRRHGDPMRAVADTTRAVGQPIVFTAIVLAAGFLVGCLSGFQPVKHFGALSAATMIIGLFADLVLTPAIATTMRVQTTEETMTDPASTTRRAATALGAIAIALVLAARGAAADDGARELVKKTLDETMRQSASASISLSSGSETRAFELIRQRSGGADQMAIKVISPYTYKGMRYLFLEKTGGGQDHYTYLPAVRRTQRIAAESLNQPFLMTEFYVVDLVKPELDDYDYRFVGEETVAGRACKLVESLPRDASDDAYSKTILAIDPVDAVVVRTQFFDHKARLLKTWTVEKLEKVDGMWTPFEQRMKPAEGPDWVLHIDEIHYGVDLRDDDFAVKSLDG